MMKFFSIRHRFILILVALLCCCVASPTIGLAADATKVTSREADEYIDLFLEVEQTALRSRALSLYLAELRRDEATFEESLLLRAAESTFRDELGGALSEALESVFMEFSQVENSYVDDLDVAVARWREYRAKADLAERTLFETESMQSSLGQLISLLNADNKWLWSFAVFSMFGLILSWSYSSRHYLRRLFWSKRSLYAFLLTVIGLISLVVLTPMLLIFLFGNQPYETLVTQLDENRPTPETQYREQINGLREQQTRQGQSADDLETLSAEISKLSNAISAQLSRTVGGQDLQSIFENAVDYKMKLIDILVEKALFDSVVEKLTADIERFNSTVTSLDDAQEKIDQATRDKQFVAALASFGIFGGFGFVAITLAWRKRTEQAAQAKVCPRCNSKGKMIRSSSSLNVPTLECSGTYVAGGGQEVDCGFTLPASYTSQPKLSFSTLGVPSSGKTHWMTMTYRDLNLSNRPGEIHCDRLSTQAANEFDEIVNDMISMRRDTTATVHRELPYPLTFEFQDRDSLGRSRLMASLFDYSGDVTRTQEHWARLRALDSDGYLFFLDPSRSVDEQAEALNLFRQDVRDIKKVRSGQTLDKPIAVCFTKLDLLPNQKFARGSIVEDFYRELGRIDSSHKPMSMPLLQTRSKLTEAILPVVFPKWQILNSIRSLFGPRVMLFPLTPVGLNDPGETDLNKLVIDAYGIVEPFMWLIHMNGYPVLNRKLGKQ